MQSNSFSLGKEKVIGFSKDRFAVLHRGGDTFLLPTISTVTQDRRFFVKPLEEDLDRLTLEIIKKFTTFEVDFYTLYDNPSIDPEMVLLYSPQLSYIRTNYIVEEEFVKIIARDGESILEITKCPNGTIVITDDRQRSLQFPQKLIEREFLVQSIIDIVLFYAYGYKTHTIHEDHFKKFAHSF